MKSISVTAVLVIIVSTLVTSNIWAQGRNIEKYRPQATLRTDMTITVQDQDGRRFPMKVKKVGKALIFQDDIVIAEDSVQGAVGVRRFIRWKDGIIPYIISPNHPYRADILRAIETLNKNTVLWYRPTTNVGSGHIAIIHGDGCYSGIGEPFFGDGQTVSIGPGCNSQGVIIHELLHAAGLFHEQSRDDRDNYVKIFWDNIQPSEKDNFEKAPWYSKDIGYYNFSSIMHYGCKDFAIDSTKKTIESIGNFAFGQRTGLSAGDVDAIKSMYYNVSPNRGKPIMTPDPLPRLVFPAACTPPPIPPATQAQCESWRAEIEAIMNNLDDAESVNERKKMLQAAGQIRRTMQSRGCNSGP
jgi:Astacin (Peptidase family M12A)